MYLFISMYVINRDPFYVFVPFSSSTYVCIFLSVQRLSGKSLLVIRPPLYSYTVSTWYHCRNSLCSRVIYLHIDFGWIATKQAMLIGTYLNYVTRVRGRGLRTMNSQWGRYITSFFCALIGCRWRDELRRYWGPEHSDMVTIKYEHWGICLPLWNKTYFW